MAGQDDSHYRPGRGLPHYLLSRNYDTSSTDSDGASRIFASSSASMTSNKESDCSSVLQIPRTFSYMSTSSSFTWSDTNSISSAPSTFQYEASQASRSINDDTRTLRNETPIHSTSEASSTSLKQSASSMSFLSDVYTASTFLTNAKNPDVNITSNWNYNSAISTRPEDMFPPYVPIFSDNEIKLLHKEAEPSGLYLISFFALHFHTLLSDAMVVNDVEDRAAATVNDVIPKTISYDACCLFGDETVGNCGHTSRREIWSFVKHRSVPLLSNIDHYGWSQECVTFAYLSELDIRSYLKNNGTISKKEDDNLIMNEKNLIANRLLRKNILVDNSMRICPRHRGAYGIDWCNRTTVCHHPDHGPSYSLSVKDCRRAKLNVCLKIEGFPIGGR